MKTPVLDDVGVGNWYGTSPYVLFGIVNCLIIVTAGLTVKVAVAVPTK